MTETTGGKKYGRTLSAGTLDLKYAPIVKKFCDDRNVKLSAILSNKRSTGLVDIREDLVRMLSHEHGLGVLSIAHLLNRNHTSIIHLLKDRTGHRRGQGKLPPDVLINPIIEKPKAAEHEPTPPTLQTAEGAHCDWSPEAMRCFRIEVVYKNFEQDEFNFLVGRSAEEFAARMRKRSDVISLKLIRPGVLQTATNGA